MTFKPNKSIYLCGYKHECTFEKIGNTRLWEEHFAKLLGVHIDTELNFKFHVKTLTLNTKINTLQGKSPKMTTFPLLNIYSLRMAL